MIYRAHCYEKWQEKKFGEKYVDYAENYERSLLE